MKLLEYVNIYMYTIHIADNAVTSSIRIAQVFPKLVGKTKKAHARLKAYRGMLKYMINYNLVFSAL